FTESAPPLHGGSSFALKRLKKFKTHMSSYAENRNFPPIDGTSGLSVYLRHGNLSVREMIAAASDPTWLSEVIWREFYQMLLDVYPRVAISAFKPEYDKIKWRGKPEHFKLWCQG